jgi:LacI family transcriptional regulator
MTLTAARAQTITIYDVAREAGVSTKTVSRVLNGEPHVREALRERVTATAASLGYRPNASARALAGSRSYLLSLYFDNPSPGYVSQVEYGALRACRNSGYHLIVEELSGPDVGRRVADLLSTVRTDGVILTPPLSDNAEVIAALQAHGTPYARIAPAPSQGADPAARVFMDDWRGAYEMTAHLQDLGHRDIAFIAGPSNHAAAARRYDGWLAAMRQRGLDPILDPALGRLRHGDFSFRSGLEQGEALLSAASRPTAVFAANDDMALGVMAVAHRLHLDVPEDLSIVGFDDSPSAQVVWPQLTTVRQPVAEMATTAAEMLIGPRGEAWPGAARQLDFSLVVRGSAGPPPTR